MADTFNTRLDIVNRALQILGAKRIDDLDNPTANADELKSVYNLKRDSLIRARNWGCCMKEGTAQLMPETPTNGFERKFRLPNDCLKLLSIEDRYTGYSGVEGQFQRSVEWKISGVFIYTNFAAPLHLSYSFRNEDVSTYDPLFCEVLAYELAIACVNRIKETNSDISVLEHLRDRVLETAIDANAIEFPNEPMPDGNWIKAREEWS